MRAFVAIDMPEEVLEVLEDLQDRLPEGRLLDPETLHLTLAFLDEITDEQAQEMHDALSALRMAPFTLALHGLGTFGARQPTALWAGVKPAPALTELQGKVKGAAFRTGIALPRRRFRPHVTLARFPERLDAVQLERLRLFLERHAGMALPEVEVDEITLFRSTLGKGGAIHEPLADYPLRG
ncbi:RNA 2',3'-cyclic phosphodiesterase [Anianabacter salinae]|uniref:RNA 2',3'-cyclic phosphodiesterase n=1 Tax=Anianabacter salinae TaxID=2851023 RepID=UPI00225E44B4|nr:RNA 2',3'-cyclic phosphodiesterase [Anianabacter salinae]